jgi:UDP-N-acetylglucosamine diphosphorylase/glucosamine-1-phosphate N-acetyltransferase
MKVCVFEDAAVGNLGPLTLTRPAFDLRCGATSLLEKQRRFFGTGETGALVRPELADLSRLEHPDLHINDPAWLASDPPAFVALVNARWLAPAAAFDFAGRSEVGLVGDQVAWVVLPASAAGDLSVDKLGRWREELPQRETGGAMITYPWHLVEHNARALEEDFRPARPVAPLPAGVTLVGPFERLRVDPAARVEPMVLIDTTKGAVTIERGAVVQAFSRIEGPCYVGPDTHLLAARVRGSSFGPQCRVGGEVEGSIVHGHSNKAHDGFLGHSYLGEWVNFGAGTHTSDLRADYGTVRFHINGQQVDSGLLKVGAFVGDHAKTSLNALFNTGSLVGPFGMLLTSGTLLPRVLPAFCQVSNGCIQEQNDLRGMFATAATMMARRGREWTAEHAELFYFLYEATTAQRRQAIRESEQRRLRRVV